MVSEREPVELEPDVAPPVEKPVPVHERALVEDQESVEDDPIVTDKGEALSEAEIGGSVTVTVAVSEAVPPLPVHVTE